MIKNALVVQVQLFALDVMATMEIKEMEEQLALLVNQQLGILQILAKVFIINFYYLNLIFILNLIKFYFFHLIFLYANSTYCK